MGRNLKGMKEQIMMILLLKKKQSLEENSPICARLQFELSY